MADKNKPKEPRKDDAAIWREIAGTVKPLPGRKPRTVAATAPAAMPPPAKPAPKDTLRIARPKPVHRDIPESLEAGRFTGVDRRQADRLRRGRLSIDRRIDLHGMTRAEAHQALTPFLLTAAETGARCVLVITGKGSRSRTDDYGRPVGGAIRNDLPGWLNMAPVRDRVLGFSQAQPQDGGEGAFYVLLRRRRES